MKLEAACAPARAHDTRHRLARGGRGTTPSPGTPQPKGERSPEGLRDALWQRRAEGGARYGHIRAGSAMPGVHSAQLTVALCDDGFMFCMSGMTFMICPPLHAPVPGSSCQQGPVPPVAEHGMRVISATCPVLLRLWLTTAQS